MRCLTWMLSALAAWTVPCQAGEQHYSPVMVPIIQADWQSPEALPRQFRNHCGFMHGQFMCADHCGIGYQLYYCSPQAFGCCHAGSGYCAGDGTLRCAISFPWPRW